MSIAIKPEASEFFKPEGSRQPSGLGCLVLAARRQGLHLSVSQLIHDNVLSGQEVPVGDILKCAKSSGLNAKLVHLEWNGLQQLKKALPAILRLKNGGYMLLLRLAGEGDAVRAVLQDPNADEDAVLAIDQIRLEEAWTGDVVLVKRDYEVSDETQPFGFGLVSALVFRERWIVRDVAISAFVLGFLALTPILFYRIIIDRVVYNKALSTFFVLCLATIVLIAFEAVFSFVRRFLVVHLTARLDVKLGTYVFDKVLNLPMDFFERVQVGLITRDMNELWKIRTFLMGQLFGTLLDSTTLFVFLPIMFFFSPIMTAAVIVLCAVIVAWLLVMLPFYRRKSAALTIAEGQRHAFLVQTLHGIRTIKSLALDARQRHIWDVHVARTAKLRFAEGMAGNLIQAVAKPIERLALLAPFALGVYLVVTTNDTVYVGALFAFILLSQRVAAPLVQMAQLINQFDEVRASLKMVANLVNQPPEEGRSGHGVRTPLRGRVQFSNVTFRYKGASSPALQNVSFDVPEGTTLGVMGRSGSGKTTLTRLLQGMHFNYEGLIKIDDIDIREYDIDHLRSSLGVVLQENFLFSGTIRENITAAKPDATFDDVVRVARLAGAEEFIDKLPRGYETHIYEGSPNLSGGQRQRLAIAHALIVNPRILILDEATSALDAESEAIVNANISRIAQGRTLIIISHRLASLISADAILVLDRGQVQDIGQHQELLERCDSYGELWHQQTHYITGAGPRSAKPVLRSPTRVS